MLIRMVFVQLTLLLWWNAGPVWSAMSGLPGQATERKTVHMQTLMRAKTIAPADDAPVAHDPPMRRSSRPLSGEHPPEFGPAFKSAGPSPLSGEPPLLVNSFAALGDNGQSIPPDTHGAAGPNHLMVVLNTEVRVQDRNGTVISTVTLNAFWAGFISTHAFDPKILYDHKAGRWIFTAMADSKSSNSAVLIGVSQTADPTGFWNLYRVDADAQNTTWADYPSLGYNRDWIVVQVNMFTVSGSVFTNSKIYTFNKADLYADGPGLHTVFSDSTAFTQAPAITYDDTLSTMYLVEQWVPDGNFDSVNRLRISSISGAVGAEAYTPSAAVVSTGDFWGDEVPDNFAPQSGTTSKIMVNDARIQNVVYRNGALWLVHTIFLPAGGSATRSGIQWWQLTPGGTILQRGQIDDPTATVFRAFPSIAVNRNNAVLIGLARFSASEFPGGGYAFRNGDDPVNTLQPDVVLKAGEAKYFKTFSGSRNRWGDYSSTVVDPVDDAGFWTIQEYADLPSGGSDRWATWWGHFIPVTTAPSVAFDITEIDLGTVGIGQIETATVAVRNTGNAVLEVDTVLTRTGVFSVDASGASIPPNDSVVITLSFNPSESGAYTDTLFMATNDTAAPEINIPLHAVSVRFGDVNDDGAVSVLDIIGLVRVLIGKDLAPVNQSPAFLTADLNEDGALDIVDIVRIVHIILHITSKPAGLPSPSPVAIWTEIRSEPDGRSEVVVSLRTPVSLAALSFTYAYDARAAAPGMPELADQANGMTIMSHAVDGSIRIVVFSPEGSTLPKGTHPLIRLPFQLLPDRNPVAPSGLTEAAAADPLARPTPVALAASGPMLLAPPSVLRLTGNRPNPFNPATEISYETPAATRITITVYNLLGQEIVRLVDRLHAPGRYTVVWNAADARGNPAASGVYIYRLTSGDGRSLTRRMTLLR